MLVRADHVVTLSYRVTDQDGNAVDEGAQPLLYLHGGYDSIFPKIEEALEGQAKGSSHTIDLAAEDAFGTYREELLKMEPIGALPGPLEVGMMFEGQAPGSEDSEIYTVVEIRDNGVVLDANHPLAGMDLVFIATITDIRPATQPEIQAGSPILN